MSRLSELHLALIAVIVHHTKTPVEEHEIESFSNKPAGEIYVLLDDLIDRASEEDSAHSILLRELLNNIVSLTVFLKPAEVQGLTSLDEPLHEQLIRGHKIPTSEELQQQLMALVLNSQAFLQSSTQEKTDLDEDPFILVQTATDAQEETLPTSPQETIAQEEYLPTIPLKTLLEANLFPTLGLRPQETRDKINRQIARIVEEEQISQRLAAENQRLLAENRRLISLRTQANPSQRPISFPHATTYPRFGFAALARSASRFAVELLFENDESQGRRSPSSNDI